MLCNISYCPQIPSSKTSSPSLKMSELLLALRDHFSCVEPVTEYAVRFRQGNTRGVILDSGYAEMVAPEQDMEGFSECARLVADVVYRETVGLRGFDAFVGKSPINSASLELYQSIATVLNMDWRLSQRAPGPLFSAWAEGMDDAYG